MLRRSIIFLAIFCLATVVTASVCVPEPFNFIDYQYGGSCEDNIPIKIAADSRGMQFTTTLANCTDNKFDIYQSNLGKIPELTLGDYFEYTIWWSEYNTQCIVDLYYYNGTSINMRDKAVVDQNGISQHPLVTVSYNIISSGLLNTQL